MWHMVSELVRCWLSRWCRIVIVEIWVGLRRMFLLMAVGQLQARLHASHVVVLAMVYLLSNTLYVCVYIGPLK